MVSKKGEYELNVMVGDTFHIRYVPMNGYDYTTACKLTPIIKEIEKW